MLRTTRSVALLAATTLGVSALSACSSGGNEHEVAAAFYPLAWATERVAGDRVEVTNLTSPGAEPHDLELSIKQTALITDADLVVLEHGMQPAVDEAVEQHADGAVIDAAEVLELKPMSEHAHEEGEEHGHDHDHGDSDPHFWQDPLLMADLGDDIAEQLTELDPDHADDYEANAAALRKDLEALDQEYAEGLRSCQRHDVVVTHDAFGYLEKYGLHLHPILGLSPDAEPSASVLSDLKATIREDGITTVFSETLVSAKTAEALAREAGVTTAVLDPVEGLAADSDGEDYLSLMRANLRVLQKANGC